MSSLYLSVLKILQVYMKYVGLDTSGHEINKGDKVIFASVGAGMHINAMVFEM